jgi:hypothetical protein
MTNKHNTMENAEFVKCVKKYAAFKGPFIANEEFITGMAKELLKYHKENQELKVEMEDIRYEWMERDWDDD